MNKRITGFTSFFNIYIYAILPFMKRIIGFLYCVIFSSLLFSQQPFLAGTEDGLYKLTPYAAFPLLKEVAIKKIIALDDSWLFLTSKGVMKSADLKTFSFVNTGLPVKIIKTISNAKKEFVSVPQPLKDLEVHPDNPSIFVTATNTAVFLTRDGGKTWKDLGCNSNRNGVKAVAVLDLPDTKGIPQLTVLVSHALNGVAWMQPDKTSLWTDISDGLTMGPESPEEVSDITVRKAAGEVEVFASHTFVPKIMKLNWQKKQFIEIKEWTGELQGSHCIDGLSSTVASLVGCKNGGLFEVPLIMPRPFNLQQIEFALQRLLTKPLCAWVPKHISKTGSPLSLSELWLLHDTKEFPYTGYRAQADGKKGLYIPAHQIRDSKMRQSFFTIIENNKLNTIVYDVKDEYGFVRYDSQDSLVKSVDAVRPFTDIDNFIAEAKARGIYLVARIVTFKDKNLYRWNNFELAVKDASGKPWQGYTFVGDKKEDIQEHWVDPYNEKVWQYTIAIAKEAVARGFDEIQFDYIRFPTDGDNLRLARYPAQEKGMDKESALMSFLAYAREEIKAPISIDIYGANGWYRTGARTGQEVELLADYVDVICPMFYPSHFAQSFLAYAPAQERPYRIYYYGSYRNRIIARNSVVVRPWAQAFYIPVSYDRKYYNEDYVQRQILGIKDSINSGYVYWNNSGRYSDIRPDGSDLIKR
ncbi:hypothetical protein DWQ65_11370 [Treponema phagedenis]|uniref:DUF4015 domain-containing protein n=2 Tax=Treponema phagedenis TaxID=162 RepID=A0A0B7GS70_TREPH|nr:hypothetical protein DWQ65_11370 [Treponema phagedenis]CEM61454.1 conserved exported hypothetical protein [Treponema phagedenis]